MYRIAIVDDDYMVRESTKAVIERNFKEENFQVECFSTFSQLQSELSQELFTVYILDIELPDGNGLELAKEIRKIQERAYIVFLTAYEKYALSWVRSPGISLYYQRKYGKETGTDDAADLPGDRHTCQRTVSGKKSRRVRKSSTA